MSIDKCSFVAVKLKLLALMGCGHAGGFTELPLGDVTADAMQLLLEWIYGSVKASLTLSQAVALFQLAHKFDILELQLQCEQTLKASVAMETYHQLQDLADRFDCTALMQVGFQNLIIHHTFHTLLLCLFRSLV